MSSSTKDPAYYRDKILALDHLEEKSSRITKDSTFRRTYIGIPESNEVNEDSSSPAQKFEQLLLDVLDQDHDAVEFKRQMPAMMKQRGLSPEHLGSDQDGRKTWQKMVAAAASYWVELQRLRKDPENLETTARTRAAELAKTIMADESSSKDVANEAIDPDQIAAIQSMKDIAKAREAAMQLAFANARSPERRADLRDQIRQAGTVTQLVKLLWSMKLSNDGLKTGSQTVRTRKGVGYSMR